MFGLIYDCFEYFLDTLRKKRICDLPEPERIRARLLLWSAGLAITRTPNSPKR